MKRALIFVLGICLFYSSFAQSGKVLEQEIIKSKILGKGDSFHQK